jgi:hypothetical protein
MPGLGPSRAGCSNVKMLDAIIAVTLVAVDIHKKSIVMLDKYILIVKHSRQTDSIPKSAIAVIRIALFRVPIVWWRKPYGGLDGHGTSPRRRCEGSPESREVSSPGKLNVFSKSSIGTLETVIHHGFGDASRQTSSELEVMFKKA